jgi:hypothetical protein
LEHQYRLQGIDKGYLQPNQYVSFSEQSYGISVVNYCEANLAVCDALGMTNEEGGSTEGGFIEVVYFLRDTVKNQILPHSVCPYQPNQSGTGVCDGYEAALAFNPLSFTVVDYGLVYNLKDIRARLIQRGYSLGLVTAELTSYDYFGCNDAKFTQMHTFLSGYTCSADCTYDCPLGYSDSTCFRCTRDFSSFGEFSVSGYDAVISSGHAMNIVGFNDDYLFANGEKGGFILKNSWFDYSYTASHSIDFLMDRISLRDEQAICPNSGMPSMWKGQELNDTLVHPHKLYQCESVTHIPREGRFGMGDLYQVTMFDYSAGEEVTWIPLPAYYLAIRYHISTANGPPPQNDPDKCGFYMLSYSAAQRNLDQSGMFYASDIKVQWDDQSYVANKALNPTLDYTLLEQSQKSQHEYSFTGYLPTTPGSYVPT